jgi:hypothetical protein
VHRNSQGAPYQKAYLKIAAAVLAFTIVFTWHTPTALAWKPATHVYLAEQALKDAKDDGKVTIERVNYNTGEITGTLGTYPIDPEILSALKGYPSQYRAGVLGPDAYPDILTGQQVIHPDANPEGSDGWLKYLWHESRSGSPAVKAFATGYLTHAAGDMYGHTFVNKFTGGAFTPTPPSNAIKHVLLESYIDKLMPRPNFSASIEGVKDFIYQKMIDAKPGSDLDKKYLREGGKGTESSVPRLYSTLRYKLQQNIDSYYKRKSEYDRRYDEKIKAAEDCEPLDFSCSATALYAQAAAIQVERTAFIATVGLATTYQEYWRNDIDDGLRKWSETSHEVAKALFFNPEDKTNVSDAQEILEDYLNQHLLSMSGAPDVVGDFAGVVDKVQDALEEQIEPIKKLKENFYSSILEQATGMSLEDLKKYLQKPALYFDQVMTKGSGEKIDRKTFHSKYWSNTEPKDFDYRKVPAAYNTVVMSKLVLLSPAGVNQLLSDLKDNVRLEPSENAMLGFIRTLDGDNEWSGQGKPNHKTMALAKTCATYRQIFMKQPGEDSNGVCSPSQRFLSEFSTRTQTINELVNNFQRELAKEEGELNSLNTWIDQDLKTALSPETTKGTIDSLLEIYSQKINTPEVRLCKSGRESVEFLPRIEGVKVSTQRMLSEYQPWKTLGGQHEQLISSLESLVSKAIILLEQGLNLKKIPDNCTALDTLPKVYSLRIQGIDVNDTSKKLGEVTTELRNQIAKIQNEIEQNKQFVNFQRAIESVQAQLSERIIQGEANEALGLASTAEETIDQILQKAKDLNIFGNEEISQLQQYSAQALSEIQQDTENNLKFETLPVLVLRRVQGLQMKISEIEQAIVSNPSKRSEWENNVKSSINELLGLQTGQRIQIPIFSNAESLLSYDTSLGLAEEKINSFSAASAETASGRMLERGLQRFSFQLNPESEFNSAIESETAIVDPNLDIDGSLSQNEADVFESIVELQPDELSVDSEKTTNQQNNMNASETLIYVVLGIILGIVGQSVRAIVGVKKSSDEASFSEKAFKDWFEIKRLIFSLIIGGTAGALGAISQLGAPIDQQFLLTIVASGYAGADFIEGFMRTKSPTGNS